MFPRENARDILLGRLDAITAIAKGGTFEVEVLEYNGAAQSYEKRRKTVVIYPRDQIAAFAKLLEISQQGVLPEKPGSSPSSWPEDTESQGVLKSFLGPSTDFTSVSATTPDGRKFRATVGQDNKVTIEKAEDVD